MTRQDAKQIMFEVADNLYYGSEEDLARATRVMLGEEDPDDDHVETLWGVFDIGGES